MTACAQDNKIVRWKTHIWAECWNLQAVPVKFERTFFIMAIKSSRRFFNMILFTTVTWLRTISVKQSVWINYKYETDTVEEARQIAFELPGYREWALKPFPFFTTSSLCVVGSPARLERIGDQSGGLAATICCIRSCVVSSWECEWAY